MSILFSFYRFHGLSGMLCHSCWREEVVSFHLLLQPCYLVFNLMACIQLTVTHRIEPDHNNPNTYFFNTYTSSSSPNLRHQVNSDSFETFGGGPWGRVFHPRPAGHRVIMEAILQAKLAAEAR